MLKCRKIGSLFLLGLILSLNRCEGRAVNISNTWTLPQDGFAVFYRFFRDKISWFEADAVCQFHHANLVTVDNGQQFDAAREFLKVLDVTDTVWIGLMRPQNSERFTWSNSKPLAATSGYWAESLPLIESPLCAVIDPVRDFRWHALRCGGPETASFLCEMNVPSWALECTIRGMSNLTTQYMADNGSVELTRDCDGDEILHQICKGKQDRRRVIKELLCKSERTAESMGPNSIEAKNLAETHHKSLQIIHNIPSDNNEDNNINFQVPIKEAAEDERKEPELNPVQKLIEQFNVEELMQADQPVEIVAKPTKKASKKASVNEKKAQKSNKKQKSQKDKPKSSINFEELMMGDQPQADFNQIQEPLPHIKKSFPQDLKHQDSSSSPAAIATSTSEATSVTEESFAVDEMQQSTTTQHTSEGTSSYSISTDNIDTSPLTTSETVTDRAIEHATSIETVQQSQSTEEPQHTSRPKEQVDNHFIPPMLLVKSHYASSKPHLDVDASLNTTLKQMESSTTHDIPSQTTFGTTTMNSTTTRTTLIAENFRTANTTFEPAAPTSTRKHQVVEIKIGSSENPAILSITTRPSATISPSQEPMITRPAIDADHTGSPVATENPAPNPSQAALIRNKFPSIKSHGTAGMATTHHPDNPDHRDYLDHHETSAHNEFGHHDFNHQDHHESSHEHHEHSESSENKFSNAENFQPYKPNRRRALTKPPATTYLKKILG